MGPENGTDRNRETVAPDHPAASIEARLAELEVANGRLEARSARLERENARLAGLVSDAQRQTAELTSLYVASLRLLESRRRQDVLQVVEEIVGALIGCERMLVFELDRDRGALRPIKAVGIDATPWREVPLGTGTIGAAATGTSPWLRSRDGDPLRPEERGLTAVVPLHVEDDLAGAIALFDLLVQKDGLAEVDLQLLDLLATQAAGALRCAALQERETPSRGGR